MKYIGVAQLANRWNISQSLIYKWCAEGKIFGAVKTSTNGHWKIPSNVSFLTKQKLVTTLALNQGELVEKLSIHSDEIELKALEHQEEEKKTLESQVEEMKKTSFLSDSQAFNVTGTAVILGESISRSVIFGTPEVEALSVLEGMKDEQQAAAIFCAFLDLARWSRERKKWEDETEKDIKALKKRYEELQYLEEELTRPNVHN